MYKNDIPASLTIAQGILESNNGNSQLTRNANNLFGIKGNGTAGNIALPTTEYVNGKAIKTSARFRKYNNWGESVADHSKLFINGTSWNHRLYHGIIGKDGLTACKEVANAGYATDPNYEEKLVKLIKDNNLLQYDGVDINMENRLVKLESDNIELRKSILSANDDITSLINKVSILEKIVNNNVSKLSEITVPKWFKDEFPNAVNDLNQKTGTSDFWRNYAITLREINRL